MKRWKNGFTLMEVLLATVMIALGFITGSAFFYTNRKNLYNARLERYATWSAIKKMEEIKDRDFLTKEETIEDIRLGEYNIPAERIISIIEDENDNLVWKVQVTIRWTGNNEISLYTYIPIKQ